MFAVLGERQAGLTLLLRSHHTYAARGAVKSRDITLHRWLDSKCSLCSSSVVVVTAAVAAHVVTDGVAAIDGSVRL